MQSASLHACYLRALREPAVWRRAVRLGSMVGFIQVALHQGDHWVKGEVTRVIVLKSITSVFVAMAVVLFASASTRAEALRSIPSP